MHPEKVTVWCGFWSGGIIGLVFFQNEAGIAIIVNGERYRSMISNFLWSKWMIWIPIICDSNRMALRATHRMPRWTFCTSNLRAWLSRAAATWTGHRDRDLTPLDFFLWGYLKSQVYTNKPQTIDAFKVNITNAIKQIQPYLCEKVIENWTARIRVTKRSRGGYLNIIFHI